MAVDSRAAAPQNDAMTGSTRTCARPGNRAARKPSVAPGSRRAHRCADAAQQQWARRPGGAARVDAPTKAVSPARRIAD